MKWRTKHESDEPRRGGSNLAFAVTPRRACNLKPQTTILNYESEDIYMMMHKKQSKALMYLRDYFSIIIFRLQ